MEIDLIDEPFPFPDSGVERSTGLHLSDIIHAFDVEYEMSPWNKKKVKSPVAFMPQTLILFQMGFIWEQALESAYKERLGFRPDEIHCEGIACSPDHINYNEFLGHEVLEEYKLTFSSSNKGPEENWRWMTQIKGYLYAAGLRHCVMRILYVCGNYGTVRLPEYKVYLLTFTELEIRENWKLLTNFAKAKGMM